MSWVTIIWSMVASACLTLAAMHFLVWCNKRTEWANLLFSSCAVSAAAIAGVELACMRAETGGQFGTLLRWGHLPFFVLIVSLVWFIRLYLHAGRPWLAWTICGARTLVLILNFCSTPNVNYLEITGLRQLHWWGGETVSVPVGIANPWGIIGQLSLLLVVIYCVDATITVWRMGDRRRAVVIGGSTVVFISVALIQAVLLVRGAFLFPFVYSFAFLGILMAMGYELSRDVLNASRLASDLRESEEHMTLASEAAGFGLWIWSLASNQILASERWCDMFGFAPDEAVTYEKAIQRIHPDDRPQVEQTVLSALAERRDYAADYRVVLPDGNHRWVAARGRVQPDANGKPARIMGATIDITRQKREEEVLRESEERFRAVANTAPVLIWMSGTDKRCNFFNKSWLDFTGRALEQELGDGWAAGVHPDDLTECLKQYIQSFDARRPFTLEYRLRRHDGEYRWISDNGVPRYDSGRNFLGYIGSCVDLTDRRQSEERFRLVVEASPNGIILADDHGRVTLVNTQTERLFGYPRLELIGQSADLLVPERGRDQFQHNLNRFREAPGVRMMGTGRELFGRRKDGTEFPLEIGLSPVQGQDGNQVLAVIVDITARKEAEAETLRQRNQLAHVARVSTMGQLASSLAHELNQPLGAIMRNAEAAELLLLEASPDLDEVRASLADIRKDDQRAGDVIDRMRALMKRGEVQRLPVDLNAMAGEVITLVRPDAYIRRVRLTLETHAALPSVIGDRVQLQQVMLNLVLNGMEALKDCPPGNRLVVMRARPSGATVEVAVSDNGNGIPEDKLARIFEPFFTSKPGGLGMGLSISRSIVAAHRGRLWAENNAGGGATFRFTLPVGEEEEDLFSHI